MTDRELIDGLLRREESALALVQQKYRQYCGAIAEKILGCRESAEEVCSDVWLRLWQSIPPARPENLRLYIGKTARNTALNRLEQENAQKRSGVHIQLEELAQCLPDRLSEVEPERLALREAMHTFLRRLPAQQRQVFVRRYWYGDTVEEIAARFACTPSRITGMLYRTRKLLKKHLEKEEINL